MAMDFRAAAQEPNEGDDQSGGDVELRSTAIDQLRRECARRSAPIGAMPLPRWLDGVAHPMVFLDLMAERLTFERIATRLYDGLLVKHDAAGSQAGGPERPDLERIRDDELRHFALLGSALESLGADSTAVTPGADLASAVSLSLIQVVTDPRATLSEALRVMLIAELADNDGWLVLADMADRLDQDALAARFREALEQEDRHLARLRTWVSAMLSEQAGLGPTAPLGVSEIGQPMLE